MNKRWILTIAGVGVLMSASVWAQQRGGVSLFQLRADIAGSPEELALANDPNKRALLDNYEGPEELILPEVKYYGFDRPSHLQGLAESLVHGITINLPPEYDHYGYELRRHMKSVGNYSIYTNQQALDLQRRNIEKSHIIFKYWRQKINADLLEVKNRIDKENGDSKARTTYKLNTAIVKAFMVETQVWINANEALLNFIAERRRSITFSKGRIRFDSTKDQELFLSLYATREKARREMYKYDPFRGMVY